jgi:hypothetical protein
MQTSPTVISKKKNAQPDQRTCLADSNGTDYGTNRSHSLLTGSLDSLTDVEDRLLFQAREEDQKPPALCALLTPEVITLFVNYALLTFLDMCMQVLLPLMWSTSVEHGGLGFSLYLIGITMGGYSIFSALVQLTLLGPIIRRYGARKVYITNFPFLLVTFLGYPVAGYFARCAGRAGWKVWCVIVVQLVVNAAIPTTYGKSCLYRSSVRHSQRAVRRRTGHGSGHLT